MTSILNSIKKLLGISADYTHFDDDIIMHINSVFTILTQLGVGPAEGFEITDSTATWRDFTSGEVDLASVKSYIYLRVKLLFDPPASSTILNAIKETIDELEWRLMVTSEPTATDRGG